MTTFYLIRHGHIDALGHSIAGRQAGVHLSASGRRQAEALAEWLADAPICRILSSPLERTQETAGILAKRLHLNVETADELIELDFGDWNGAQVRDLQADPQWERFNAFRSGARIPGGESMLEVQTRLIGLMERLRAREPQECIALVSHGDVIRAGICYWLSVPIDLLNRIEISVASASVIRVDERGCVVLSINAMPESAAARDN